MKDAIRDILSSRKALMVLVVMLCATLLVTLGKMTTEQWESVAKWLGGLWLGAQAIEDAFVKSAAIKAGAIDVEPKVTGKDP